MMLPLYRCEEWHLSPNDRDWVQTVIDDEVSEAAWFQRIQNSVAERVVQKEEVALL